MSDCKTHEDKFGICVFDSWGKLIGVLDVIRDYKTTGEWTLGLLLLHPTRRSHGLGESVYRAVEHWATQLGAQHIRFGIVEEKRVLIASGNA